MDDDLWDPPTLDDTPDDDEAEPSSLRAALVGLIQAARARAGWTVERLADEAGFGRKAVSRVLNGHRAPMGTLERLLRALGLEVGLVEAISEFDAVDADGDDAR